MYIGYISPISITYIFNLNFSLYIHYMWCYVIRPFSCKYMLPIKQDPTSPHLPFSFHFPYSEFLCSPNQFRFYFYVVHTYMILCIYLKSRTMYKRKLFIVVFLRPVEFSNAYNQLYPFFPKMTSLHSWSILVYRLKIKCC